MTLMGLVTSYPGLLVARFALGVAEAGLFPGRYTSMTILPKTLTDFQKASRIIFLAGTKAPKLACVQHCSSRQPLWPARLAAYLRQPSR
jgi:hypothetical protein